MQNWRSLDFARDDRSIIFLEFVILSEGVAVIEESRMLLIE